MHFTISLRAEDFLIQKLKTVFSPLYSLMVLAISGSATAATQHFCAEKTHSNHLTGFMKK